MEHTPDGLIRDMKVEDMRVDESGRTFITYSFGPVMPLDKVQLSITKTNSTTWDEFKEQIAKVVSEIERHEKEICEYDVVQVFSDTDIGEFVASLSETVDIEATICAECRSPLDEEKFCMNGCDDTHCAFCNSEFDEDGFCPKECEDRSSE